MEGVDIFWGPCWLVVVGVGGGGVGGGGGLWCGMVLKCGEVVR